VESLCGRLEQLSQAATAITGTTPDFLNLAGGSDGSGGCVATLSDHAPAARSARVKAMQTEQIKLLEPHDPDVTARPIVDFGCHAHKVDNAAKAVHSSLSTFQWPPGFKPVSLPNMTQSREDVGASASGGAMKAQYLIGMVLAPSEQHGKQWLAGPFKAYQLSSSDQAIALPQESKARFLEQAYACAVIINERSRILGFLKQLCSNDRRNIVQNIISALEDKPTMLQFILCALWYFR
jgi:hypothetical protein